VTALRLVHGGHDGGHVGWMVMWMLLGGCTGGSSAPESASGTSSEVDTDVVTTTNTDTTSDTPTDPTDSDPTDTDTTDSDTATGATSPTGSSGDSDTGTPPTVLTLTFAPADGEPAPAGVAELTRQDTHESVDDDGQVLVPGVSEADHGTVEIDHEVQLNVPDGHLLYRVDGFDSSGYCESIEPAKPQFCCCEFAGWEGQASVYVGDHWSPGELPAGAITVPRGGTGSVEIEVTETCSCPD